MSFNEIIVYNRRERHFQLTNMTEAIRRSSRRNKGTSKYLQYLAQDEEEYVKAKSGSVLTEDEVTGRGADSVRCLVCGTTDENYDENNDPYGDMIQCDGCDTWQHIACMSRDESLSSDEYFCNVCAPTLYPNLKYKIDPTPFINKKLAENKTKAPSPVKKRPVASDDDFIDDDQNNDKKVRNKYTKRRKSAENEPGNTPSGHDKKLRESALKMFTDLFLKYVIPDTLSEGLFKLPNDELAENLAAKLANELERELYEAWYDYENSKLSKHYAEKVRILFSNLKDRKNNSLKEHVVNRKISLHKLVRMSVNELVNPDLQLFREKVDKDALDQLVLEQPDKPKYVKTHRGDELIEDPNEYQPEDAIFNKDFTISHQDDSKKQKQEQDSTSSNDYTISSEKGLADAPKNEASRKSSSHEGAATSPADTLMAHNEQKLLEATSSLPELGESNINYPDIGVHFHCTLKFLGTSSDLKAKVYEEALGDKSLLIEGRLGRAEADRYLHQLPNKRVLLAYQVLTGGSEAGNSHDLYEYLLFRDRYGAIEKKKHYEKDIYVIPCNGTKLPNIFDKISIVNPVSSLGSENLFIVIVVKSEYIT